MSTPHINDLREHLMATLAALRDRDNPMEPDRARAMAQVASVLVDTAKVEIDYIKATGNDHSDFLAPAVFGLHMVEGTEPAAHNPFPTVARHRLQG